MADVLPLEGTGLTVQRGGRALLDSVSIRIGGHDRLVLLGPNGAGKSILLRVLVGLVRPDAGTVHWAGMPPDRARATRIGFVFQRPAFLRRSATANLRYVLGAAGVPRADRESRASAALAWAGLETVAQTPARSLSGGEQQRLAIARAMVTRPGLLILDEPTANLDPAATAAVEALVRDTSRNGVKTVVVTHDVAQARRLAETVVFLDRGRIAEEGPADGFFAAPSSAAARNYLDGRLPASPLAAGAAPASSLERIRP
jgi:tungstate transport system ATP-binding protein